MRHPHRPRPPQPTRNRRCFAPRRTLRRPRGWRSQSHHPLRPPLRHPLRISKPLTCLGKTIMVDDDPTIGFSEDGAGDGVGSSGAAGEVPWFARLQKTKGGTFLGILSNAEIILDHDPALVGLLAYDNFACKSKIMKIPPDNVTNGKIIKGPY